MDAGSPLTKNPRAMANCIKLRINAKQKSALNPQDNATANTYGNKFIISLDFEMLDSVIRALLSIRTQKSTCYEITFNEYGKLSMHQDKYEPQMLRIRSMISP